MAANYVELKITWASERHVRIALPDDRSSLSGARIRRVAEALRRAGLRGLIDLTPAYSTILLEFAIGEIEAGSLDSVIRQALESCEETGAEEPGRIVEVPVCYEGRFAPDAGQVAELHKISAAELIRLHSTPMYEVRFIGFGPGFGYLSGLPPELHTPRLPTPRVRVPAGSVGIAGDQTGVYATESAGGWRLIGRTPLAMFDPGREPPALLAAGDRVRFVPITAAEFETMQREGPSHD